MGETAGDIDMSYYVIKGDGGYYSSTEQGREPRDRWYSGIDECELSDALKFHSPRDAWKVTHAANGIDNKYWRVVKIRTKD